MGWNICCADDLQYLWLVHVSVFQLNDSPKPEQILEVPEDPLDFKDGKFTEHFLNWNMLLDCF